MNHRMTMLVDGLKQQATLLEAEIARLKAALECAPEGRLRINKQRGRARYYVHTCFNDRAGKYTSDDTLIHSLAQKQYDKYLLTELNKELAAIKEAIRALEQNSYERAFSSISELRHQLIIPGQLEHSDDEVVSTFLAKPYTTKGFKDTDKEHYSAKGVRTRSKSESDIMNCLDNALIPYRYEEQISLGGVILHPDFTVMNRRTHAQYFWEHCGMMDNLNYTMDFVRRMNLYNKYGINPGKNLILTFETAENPLNVMVINKVIRTYLL